MGVLNAKMKNPFSLANINFYLHKTSPQAIRQVMTYASLLPIRHYCSKIQMVAGDGMPIITHNRELRTILDLTKT